MSDDVDYGQLNKCMQRGSHNFLYGKCTACKFSPNVLSTAELMKQAKKELNGIVACILQVDTDTASDFTSKVGKALGAKLAAAGATAGFLGLVSSFGTAGTGTAIATLSGAAATSATLAWVGGLVGGGMAAGSVLTGGLGVLVAVGAYQLFGEVFDDEFKARKYEELKPIDKQVVDVCVLLIKAIDNELPWPKAKPAEVKVVFETAFRPLFLTLKENRDDIASRLAYRHRLALKIGDIRRFLVNDYSVYLHNHHLEGA